MQEIPSCRKNDFVLVGLSLRKASAVLDQYTVKYAQVCKSCGSLTSLDGCRCGICGDRRLRVRELTRIKHAEDRMAEAKVLRLLPRKTLTTTHQSHFIALAKHSPDTTQSILNVLCRISQRTNAQSVYCNPRVYQHTKMIIASLQG